MSDYLVPAGVLVILVMLLVWSIKKLGGWIYEK